MNTKSKAQCQTCLAPLAEHATGHCPECGRWFDLADPDTFLAIPPSRIAYEGIASVFCVAAFSLAARMYLQSPGARSHTPFMGELAWRSPMIILIVLGMVLAVIAMRRGGGFNRAMGLLGGSGSFSASIVLASEWLSEYH